MKRRTVKPAATPPVTPRWSKGESYPCPEMHTRAVRPGADNADAHPSRMGNFLHYRDGRITDLQGNPLEAWQA